MFEKETSQFIAFGGRTGGPGSRTVSLEAFCKEVPLEEVRNLAQK